MNKVQNNNNNKSLTEDDLLIAWEYATDESDIDLQHYETKEEDYD